MTSYFVTYQYRGSKYFDSPLYFSRARKRCDSYAEARAWADAPHPEIEGYKVLGIHAEGEIVTGRDTVSPAERARISDRCTDVCIVSKY